MKCKDFSAASGRKLPQGEKLCRNSPKPNRNFEGILDEVQRFFCAGRSYLRQAEKLCRNSPKFILHSESVL